MQDHDERLVGLEALRRGDARYRAVLLASAAIVWIASPGGEFVEVQPAWEDYTGQTWDEYRGSNWISAIHPDDRDQVMRDWTGAVHAGASVYRTSGRIWSVRHQGWRTFQTRAVPVRSAAGEIIEWIGALTDVQDAVDAQLRLAKQDDDTKRMHDVSTRLLQAEGVEALLHEILQAALAITGAPRGNIQILEGNTLRITAQHGFNDQFIRHFNTTPDAEAACRSALQRGERVIVEDVATDPLFDRRSRDILLAAGARAVQSTPLVSRSGSIVGMLSTHYDQAPRRPDSREARMLDLLARQAADVIERQRAEEQLRYRSQQFETLVERSPFGIYIVDADFRIAHMNEASQAGAFRNVRPVIGRPFDEAVRILWPEPVAADIVSRFRETLETGAPYYSRNFVQPRKDVAAVEGYEWELHRIVLGDGRRGVICYYYDSTALRESEQTVRRLVTTEQELRLAAEEANRLKDEFLATISHELRTPLNAVLGWAAMLEQIDSAPSVRRGLHSVNRNAHVLAKMIDDLLDVSRIISGKLRLDPRPVDVKAVVDAAVETILPTAAAKNIHLELSIEPASQVIYGDATRLQQAVWNLLSNAVKFTPRGGRVNVTARVVASHLEMVVRDSGIGVDASFLPHVFERFRQADGSTTRTHGGLGLGLAIVRHILDLHGGNISVESAGRDQGTTFIVQLPVGAARSATDGFRTTDVLEPAVTPGDVRGLQGVRVLIVDDDHESCEVFSEILRRRGAVVQTASSTTDGTAALQTFQPAVVVSDIAMPERDGFSLLAEVRAFEIATGRRLPIIAATAQARAEDCERALTAGFDEYLVKPIHPDRLAATIAALAGVVRSGVDAEPHGSV